MTRCKHAPHSPPSRAKRATAMLIQASLLAAMAAGIAQAPAWAQYQALNIGVNSVNDLTNNQQVRVFPQHSLFGTLVIENATTARINGKPYRIAPGMRLFTQSNALVHASQTAGQRLRVRYLMETATGMLQTAWILRETEMPPRRFFGLFGPDTQDPVEIQTGPLGVGISKNSQAKADGTTASSAFTPSLGNNTIGGH